MNGAESLVRTLVGAGADVCFTNPGTSEMHYVAALDRVEGMHCVLCLFEGVATGAADGWARMSGRPGTTLLHLGPGLANGLANLHNAKKAGTPIVNIVGEHTTSHLAYDAPLSCDIETLARPMSGWVRTGKDSRTIAQDGAEALSAAQTGTGHVATLILPADTAWGPSDGPAAPLAPPPKALADEAAVAAAADALRTLGRGAMLMLGADAVRGEALETVARIAEVTGARFLGGTSLPRVERGVGRVVLPRLPYPIDQSLATLADVETLILVGAKDPVAFFNYPGKPNRLMPPAARVLTLAAPGENVPDALARVADRVGAKGRPAVARFEVPPLPKGELNAESCAAIVAALLPDGAIVVDESLTMGRNTGHMTATAAPHDWLQITGGSIGIGPPLALGAGVACPDRKVVCLQADGSGMYTLQGLWSQARARADVITVVWSNRSYAILKGELMNVGANPGRKALDMISLSDPDLDWVSLARGMGVDGVRVETAEAFAAAFRDALAERGPFLIEVVL